jgi:hypothetical protein
MSVNPFAGPAQRESLTGRHFSVGNRLARLRKFRRHAGHDSLVARSMLVLAVDAADPVTRALWTLPTVSLADSA